MLSSRAAARISHVLSPHLPTTTTRLSFRRDFGIIRPRYNAWSGGQQRSHESRFVPAVMGGGVGGGFVMLAWFLWDGYLDPWAVTEHVQQAQNHPNPGPDQFKVHFREITPGPTDEVIKALKEVADKYSPWIPGGREFVETAFSDLERVREKYETEVNDIVRDTYEELRHVSTRRETSLDTVNAIWYVLSRRLEELSSLAGDVAQQILDRHPEISERLDCSFEQLRRLGDRLGAGAKREVDETFCEVAKIVKQGVNESTADRINKMMLDKAQHIKSRREQAWFTAMEQVQPMLERNPRVKRILDDNMDILRQGRATEVSEKIHQAVMSGSTGELERYITDITKKTQLHSTGSLSNWLSKLPDGSKILAELHRLKEVAETRGADAERLAREIVNDVSRILEQRTRQAEELVSSRSKDHERKTVWF